MKQFKKIKSKTNIIYQLNNILIIFQAYIH